MSYRPGPLLRRAVELLEDRGEISRDMLIAELWPLVQPGIAFRDRQAEAMGHHRRRGTGRSPAPIPTEIAVQIGARHTVMRRLCDWQNKGILERVGQGDQIIFKLGRYPASMS